MTNMIQRGQDFLSAKLLTHASVEVSYVRGATTIAAIRALPGQTLLKLADGDGGSRVQWTDRDFLIASASLLIAAAQIEPQPGDKIIEVQGVLTYTYEVLAYGGSEPAWRWSDAGRTMRRIHTKEVDIS